MNHVLAIALVLTAPDVVSADCVRFYCRDVEKTLVAMSDCAPCNLGSREINAYIAKNADLGWRFGIGETRADGRSNHIALVKADDAEAVPYFVAVENGRETNRVDGYESGDVGIVLKLYPKLEEAPKSAAHFAVDDHWTWPGGSIQALRQHMATSHGWSMSFVNRLTPAELQRLHDRCHNVGRVTPMGQQRWAPQTVAQAAPTYSQPAYSYQRRTVTTYAVPFAACPCPGGCPCPGCPGNQQPAAPPTGGDYFVPSSRAYYGPVIRSAPPVIYDAPPVIYAAPRVVYAAPRYAAPYRSAGGSSYRQSSGFQMFGIPIMGSYRSGSSGGSYSSACPGGICP